MGHEHGAGQGQSDALHVPVLLAEVLSSLGPLDGALVVDGTFGAGGYSRALLQAGARVVGIDRDPNVLVFADQLKQEFPDRFQFVAGQFSQMDEIAGVIPDRVVLDIGVSSMQLDEAGRGFSFMRDGPLDMRMGAEGQSAADLVNTLTEKELASVLFAYGEERKSRRIAAAIVQARNEVPFATTLQLADLIEKTIGRRPSDMHPATRSFQALRIAVNAEFDELVQGLFAAERLLPDGGKIAVVTFHSLEDRIVKRFFAPDKTGPTQSRHLPHSNTVSSPWASVMKPIKAGKTELDANPRARSATLRSASRTGTEARNARNDGLGVPNARLRGAA